MSQIHISEAAARLDDGPALESFLETISHAEQVRERLGQEFFVQSYDHERTCDTWIVSDGTAFHALAISPVAPEESTRIRQLYDERRDEFSTAAIASIVAEAMGFATHVVKRMDAEYERAMATIGRVAGIPADKWKRKDMEEFTALLKEEIARWRAGQPMRYREELTAAFGCDPVAAFMAGDYWAMTRRCEGTA